MAKQKKTKESYPSKIWNYMQKPSSFHKWNQVQIKLNKEFGHSDTDSEFLTKADNTTMHDIDKTHNSSSFLSCIPIWYYFINHC